MDNQLRLLRQPEGSGPAREDYTRILILTLPPIQFTVSGSFTRPFPVV